MRLLKIVTLLQSLSLALPAHAFRKGLDAALDVFEAEIAASPNEVDDLLAQPLIDALRRASKTPDDYDGDPD